MSNVQDKMILKNQAKQMLLKGCYKMSSNKYKRLIEMNSDGFNEREWSVVHLNTGIALQFQDKLEQALQYVNKAIKIDKTYQKAYYRRLQILEQQGNIQLAINDSLVPYFIKNKEIQLLQSRIREEYQNSLGFGELQKKLIDKDLVQKIGEKNIVNFIKQTYIKLFQKLRDQLFEQNQNKQDLVKLQKQLANHYIFIKQKYLQACDYFCHEIRRCLVKKTAVTSNFFLKFWVNYRSKFVQNYLKNNNITSSQQVKLLAYYPCIIAQPQIFIQIINIWLKFIEVHNYQQLFLQFVQINHQLIQVNKNQDIKFDYLSDNIYTILWLCSQNLISAINNLNFQKYNKYTILIQSLSSIQIALSQNKHLITQDYETLQSAFITKYLRRSRKQKIQDVQKQMNILVQIFSSCQNNTACIWFICEQFSNMKLDYIVKFGQIMFEIVLEKLQILIELPKNKKNIVHIILLYNILTYIMGFKLSKFQSKTENKNNKQQALSIHTQIQNILVNVPQVLDHIQVNKITHISKIYLIQKYLKSLNNLLVTSPKTIFSIIKYQKYVCQTLIQLFSQTQSQYSHTFLMPLAAQTIKFMYQLTIDIQQQQQHMFADKMGVSTIQVSKARSLQSQKIDKNMKIKITQSRQNYISRVLQGNENNGWILVLNKILYIFNKVYGAQKKQTGNEATLNLVRMLTKILQAISKKAPNKFYASIFVTSMLNFFNKQEINSEIITINNVTISQFFSNICKKCNPQIFIYPQHQSITDILVYGIKNANHELHIFESLLALVQLSSYKINVPLNLLIDQLIQQNQYIVHSALQVINNILINLSDPEKDLKFIIRICDIVIKYYKYYRDMILKKDYQEHNINDYSHPCKIYQTIIAIFMISEEILGNIQLQQAHKIRDLIHENIHELINESQAERTLDLLSGDYSLLVFRLGIHFGKKSSKMVRNLPLKHANQLYILRQTDEQKWKKLQYYINH